MILLTLSENYLLAKVRTAPRPQGLYKDCCSQLRNHFISPLRDAMTGEIGAAMYEPTDA